LTSRSYPKPLKKDGKAYIHHHPGNVADHPVGRVREKPDYHRFLRSLGIQKPRKCGLAPGAEIDTTAILPDVGKTDPQKQKQA
jgi:hypothetical protein